MSEGEYGGGGSSDYPPGRGRTYEHAVDDAIANAIKANPSLLESQTPLEVLSVQVVPSNPHVSDYIIKLG